MTSDVEPLGKTVAFSHALFLRDDPELALQIKMVNDARERKKEQETRKTQFMKRTAEEVLESGVSAKKVARLADTDVLGAAAAAKFQAEINACKILEFPRAPHLFPPGRATEAQAGPLDGQREMISRSPQLLRILDDRRRQLQSSLLLDETAGIRRAMIAGGGAAGLITGSVLGSTLGAREVILMRSRGLNGVSGFLPNGALAESFRQQRATGLGLGLDHLGARLQNRHLELLQLQSHAAQARNLSMSAMLSASSRMDSLLSSIQSSQTAGAEKAPRGRYCTKER
jgi:hypothetical protein